MPAPAQIRRLMKRIPGVDAVHMGRSGYLAQVGWPRSRREERPVDGDGRTIPWFTYPAIDFLSDRLPPDASVFEWGAGASTRWFAERVATVRSCEHDAGWYATVTVSLAANASVALHPVDSDEYVNEVARHGPLDIVVIDGRRRNECAAATVEALSERGVIIWDNSERESYRPALQRLADQGFRRIDFTGPHPCVSARGATSVCYRDGNCLGI
ncbi:MAG: FkbM family methyltransferase [Microthrixaceae bacterium]